MAIDEEAVARVFARVQQIANSRTIATAPDAKRLAHLVKLVGAIGADVAYDRVTTASIRANLERLTALSVEWLVELDGG